MLRWLLPVVMVFGVACSKRDAGEAPTIAVDETVRRGIEERTQAALESKRLSTAFDSFFENVAADPRVLGAGASLAEELMSDAAVGKGVETIMTQVGDAPPVQAALADLVKQHPDATPEQIGELFGQLFATRWETPEVNTVWMGSWDKFLGKLGSSSTLTVVYQEVSSRVFKGFDEPRMTKYLNTRLAALNGGKAPDQATGARLYIEHAWATPRVEELFGKLLENPTVRAASTAFASELLADPEIRAALKKQAAALSSDPAVIALVVRAMQSMYAKDLDVAEIKISLDSLLTHPTVIGAVRNVLESMIKTDAVRSKAQKWLDTVRADKSLGAAFETFMTGW